MKTALTRPAVTDEARYERLAVARITDALYREFAGRVPAELIPVTVAQHTRASPTPPSVSSCR
jgi:hypothetical protein